MKKYLLGIVACFALATLASCEQDAPEINFSHTTNIVSDFSGVIKAINDMSLSLSEKMEIINNAIKDQTLTLSQKMDILNETINKGILTYQQMTQKIIDAINAMNASTAEKLAAIQTALTEMNGTLTEKLALIEAAITTGLADVVTANELIEQAIASLEGTVEEKLAALEAVLTTTNTTLGTKLAAIEAAVNAGFVSAAEQERLTREALIASLTEGFGNTAAGLDAVNKALGRLSIQDGIYAADATGMTVSPSAWEALKEDPEMYNAFLNSLEVVTPTVTTSQVSSHSCVIGITLVTFEAIELLSAQTIYNDNGVSKPAYKIVRMFSKATYKIDKGGCALGCYEINITDVAGTTTKYNFNGGAGGNVELVFWDGADKFVLAGHVEVVMR